MPRVRIVVSEQKKQEWKDYADGNAEYDSLSDLIRTAVANEMNESSGEGSSLTEEQVDELLSSLDSIETGVNQTQTEVKALRTENVDHDEMEELMDSTIEYSMDRILGNLDVYAPHWFDMMGGQGVVRTK